MGSQPKKVHEALPRAVGARPLESSEAIPANAPRRALCAALRVGTPARGRRNQCIAAAICAAGAAAGRRGAQGALLTRRLAGGARRELC